MYLQIDPSKKNEITLVLFDEHKIESKVFEGQNRDALQYIDSFLHDQELAKSDVQGIAVVVGTGSFTSTRIAITIANAWTFAHSIPLLTVSQDQSKDVVSLLPLFGKQLSGQYVSATYSGEPNIGSK